MTVAKVGIFPGDPYPELRLLVDNVPVAMVPDQQKEAVWDAGYAYLGPDFEGIVPAVSIAIGGRVETLRGYTDDPRVLDHFRDFIRRISG